MFLLWSGSGPLFEAETSGKYLESEGSFEDVTVKQGSSSVTTDPQQKGKQQPLDHLLLLLSLHFKRDQFPLTKKTCSLLAHKQTNKTVACN